MVNRKKEEQKGGLDSFKKIMQYNSIVCKMYIEPNEPDAKEKYMKTM